jgi:phage shock protein A
MQTLKDLLNAPTWAMEALTGVENLVETIQRHTAEIQALKAEVARLKARHGQ